MARTPRLGITLPEGATNVTTQFFVDRYNEIDAGAETPAGAQAKVDALKASTQNTKITQDNGRPAVVVESPQRSLIADILAKGPGLHTFWGSAGVRDMPSGAGDMTGIAHVISADQAFLFATDVLGEQYVRVRNSGSWKPWANVPNSSSPTWYDITLVNGWWPVSGYPPQYAVIGNTIHFRGRIQGGTYSPGANNYPPAFTLPEQFRPSTTRAFILAGYNTVNWAKVYVLTSGVVTMITTSSGAPADGVIDLAGLSHVFK